MTYLNQIIIKPQIKYVTDNIKSYWMTSSHKNQSFWMLFMLNNKRMFMFAELLTFLSSGWTYKIRRALTFGTWWMSKSCGSLRLSISAGSRRAPLPLWQACLSLSLPPRHRTHHSGHSRPWDGLSSPDSHLTHWAQPQPWPPPDLRHAGSTAERKRDVNLLTCAIKSKV